MSSMENYGKSRHLWLIIGVLSILIAIPLIAMAFNSALYGQYYGRPYGMMGYLGFGWIPVAWIGFIAVVLLIVLAISTFERNNAEDPGKDNPIHTLKMRLAKGEITSEEYNSLIEELRHDR